MAVAVLAPRHVREREHALRCQVARAERERDLARGHRDQAQKHLQLVQRQLGNQARDRCVYCGTPIAHGRACHGHESLLAIDPHYAEARS